MACNCSKNKSNVTKRTIVKPAAGNNTTNRSGASKTTKVIRRIIRKAGH